MTTCLCGRHLSSAGDPGRAIEHVSGMTRLLIIPALAMLILGMPHPGVCQTSDSTPITPGERVNWIVDGTVGPRTLFVVSPLAAAGQTQWNKPEEWHRSWSGFGKRYLHQEADVAISSTLEAGVGALWGEEPRYRRMGSGSFGARAKWALRTAFVAQRRDGRLHPAWGRYVGNTANNVIENAWLPPSATTVRHTILRSAAGFATRIGGNAWEEFWPDVARRLHKPF
jgi:hypothetical protein